MFYPLLGAICNGIMRTFFINPKQQKLDTLTNGMKRTASSLPHYVGASDWLRESNGASSHLAYISSNIPAIRRWEQRHIDVKENVIETVADSYWGYCVVMGNSPEKFVSIIKQDLYSGTEKMLD